MFWLLDGNTPAGPFTAAEAVWRLQGDLRALACPGERPSRDRYAWKLASLYPELAQLKTLLPQVFTLEAPSE